MNVVCGHGQEKVPLKGIHILILEEVSIVLYLLLTKVPWKSHFYVERSADRLTDLSLVTMESWSVTDPETKVILVLVPS